MLQKIRSAVTWKKVVMALYIVALFAVVVVIQLLVNRSFLDEGKLIKAFEQTKATPVRGKLQVVGNFGEKYMTTEDKESLIDYVSRQLGITDTLKKEVVRGDTTISITAQTKGASSQTDIEAISITDEGKKKIMQTTQYLYVTIDFFEDMSSVMGYKDIIEDTFEEVGIENVDSSVVLTGVYQGKLSRIDKDNITDTILEGMQGEVVTENRSDSIYTVYAYTHNIGNSLETEGSQVNLNIAFSYDEKKEETTLYLASPIVNEDY